MRPYAVAGFGAIIVPVASKIFPAAVTVPARILPIPLKIFFFFTCACFSFDSSLENTLEPFRCSFKFLARALHYCGRVDLAVSKPFPRIMDQNCDLSFRVFDSSIA